MYSYATTIPLAIIALSLTYNSANCSDVYYFNYILKKFKVQLTTTFRKRSINDVQNSLCFYFIVQHIFTTNIAKSAIVSVNFRKI